MLLNTVVVNKTSAPCWDAKSNGRAKQFYLRGAAAFRFIGHGLLPSQLHDPAELRIGVVMPWVQAQSGRSSCAANLLKVEATKYGAPCAAWSALPASWPYWVASAASNANVADFLLMHGPEFDAATFHERAGLASLPTNLRAVRVPNMTALYQRRLGVVGLTLTVEKIKDFKPMIGQVFRQHLHRYSHWAFGDIDVVYGRLSHFLTPRVLRYDVISFRCDEICFPMFRTLMAGQLTVFANTNWTRQAYATVPGWQSLVLDPAFLFFDERLLPRQILREQPQRVAMIVSQLTDRDNARRPAGRASRYGGRRSLIWTASEGSLLVLRSLDGRSGTSSATGAASYCVESEFALVHLNLHKFVHFGSVAGIDQRGFVYESGRGIVRRRALLSRETGGNCDCAAWRRIADKSGRMRICSKYGGHFFCRFRSTMPVRRFRLRQMHSSPAGQMSRRAVRSASCRVRGA
jgi:hypothetical protein